LKNSANLIKKIKEQGARLAPSLPTSSADVPSRQNGIIMHATVIIMWVQWDLESSQVLAVDAAAAVRLLQILYSRDVILGLF
jgi:hypothetical protein